MFINKALDYVQNSKFAAFVSNSLIFENIDNISFILLIITIISTSFMSSGFIGLFAALFAFSCFFKAITKRGETAELSFINKILIIYFLFVIISTLGASLFVLSLKGILKTFIYAIFYFALCYFLATNKKRIIPTVFVIASVVSIESIIGIFQNLIHVEEIATWQDANALTDPTRAISRAYGTLKPYNPNLLAGYLVAGLSSIFALFGISYTNKKTKSQIIFGVLFLISIFGIFVTGSRGAYLGLFGFLLTIFSYLIYVVKKYFGGFSNIKKRYKVILASFATFCIGIVCLVPSFLERLKSIFAFRGDSSISFRMNVYEASYQMFLDNKFLGIGVGNKNFREIYGLYMKTGYDALGTYCVPLEIAVESGIFALISFMAFIILVGVRSIKYTLNKNMPIIDRILIFSVLLTIAGVMFHGLFDTVFFRPQIQIVFWTNIAIFHSITIDREKLKTYRLKRNF